MLEATLAGPSPALEPVPSPALRTPPAAAPRRHAGSPWAGSALTLPSSPDDHDDVPARRHLLRDVGDRYMASYVGRNGNSRCSTLAMWVAFLGDRYIDDVTPQRRPARRGAPAPGARDEVRRPRPGYR